MLIDKKHIIAFTNIITAIDKDVKKLYTREIAVNSTNLDDTLSQLHGKELSIVVYDDEGA
jgi:hypothetical protein